MKKVCGLDTFSLFIFKVGLIISVEKHMSIKEQCIKPLVQGLNGGENGNPLQYSCLEKSHGGRSLVGYSPWGCKESDTTEPLTHCYS